MKALLAVSIVLLPAVVAPADGAAQNTRLGQGFSRAAVESLMRHLGIERAHLVGHSSGGNIAIQLALDAPNMVSSLAILEPALPVAPNGAQRLLAGTPRGADAAERYRAGDKAGAVDAFMQIVAGAAYRPTLEGLAAFFAAHPIKTR